LSVATLSFGAACSDAATAPVVSAPSTLDHGTDTSNTSTPVPSPAPTPTPVPTSPSTASGVLLGATLWVDPNSNAKKTADAWRASRPADAAALDKIASQPQARWFGDWNTNIAADVDAATGAISASGAVPVFVAYNIPQRDCGGLSGGNVTSVTQYKQWIAGFASGIGSRRAVVILEPDALANMDCLSAADQQTRLSLLSYAVATFKSLGATAVYLDGGQAGWQSAPTMATRLRAAGVADAAGFFLNVSNFVSDADNIAYGGSLSALIGGKHYVIDSSRNGLGPTADAQWCNPAGRALGRRPTTTTGIAGLDAFLWIKAPGESDGACNGGPDSGVWWPDYAVGLAQRAAY
jgi:endoglucanase